MPLCPLAFFFASRHHFPMGISTTHHPPFFEEGNIFFFPTQLPMLPYHSSPSPSCHFHCFLESFSSLCHLSHCFITILNIPHCCSNCMVIIFIILSSFVIAIPIIPSLFPPFRINPIILSPCHCHVVLFIPLLASSTHVAIPVIIHCSQCDVCNHIILVYLFRHSSQIGMSPNQNVPFQTKISTWTFIFNVFGRF